MRRIFLSAQAKALVDILLVLVFIVSQVYANFDAAGTVWRSSHCIIGILWFLMMLVHVWQHWALIKSFTKKKVIRKNRTTAVTIAIFILISLSLLLMIAGQGAVPLKFHNIVAHVFIATMIVHAVERSKRFVRLFRRQQAVSCQ